jgi:hypothetical protein
MFFARFASAFPSIAPPIPEITYGALTGGGTQITATIDNFSSDFSYIATTNVGTLSKDGANITVTGLPINTSVNIVVIATSARGLSTPSSAVTDRQPYTFRTETRTGTRLVDTTSCYPASPGPSCPFGGVLNQAGTECCVASSYTEEFTFEVQIRNPAPAGYLDSGFDWYRVSNVSIERIPYTFTTRTESYTFPCPGTCCNPCQVPCQVPGTCQTTENYCCFCCGDPCVNFQCPPTWSCNCSGIPPSIECRCCNSCCVCQRQITVPCQVPGTCPGTCCSPCTVTCSGTRQVTTRDPIPSGYLDSGVDWYRFL